VSVIPNAVDTRAFHPQEREACRRALGLDRAGNLVLFASQSRDSPFKGFDLLLAATRRLRAPDNYVLVCVGTGSEPIEAGISSVDLGVVTGDRAMARVYGAADVLVVPSRADNFPNTILEALSCGRPVIGNTACGVPEMVQPGRTGAVVNCTDDEAFARAIEQVADRSRDYTGACRQTAVSEYSLSVQAKRYIRLYTRLIEDGQKG
jgi:glycosyltransferase involved in cell wall biosynthesis